MQNSRIGREPFWRSATWLPQPHGWGWTTTTRRGGGTLREAYPLKGSSLSWDLMTISILRSEAVLGVGKSEPRMPQEQRRQEER